MTEQTRDTLGSLLEIVERDREQRCREAREQSDAEARAIVGQARHRARERVNEAVRDARRRCRIQLDETRAALVTEARQRHNAASQRLLEQAWDTLPDALRRRWEHAEHRASWIDALLALAQESLLPGTWQIEHPAGWDAAERDRMVERVTQMSGSAPSAVLDEGIEAGLRLRVGSACLDATVEGLLADRQAVEQRLLAEMVRQVDPAGTREQQT